jgi:hypothetical protein
LAQNFLTKPAALRVKVRIACVSHSSSSAHTRGISLFFCKSVKRYIGRSGIISHRQNTCMRIALASSACDEFPLRGFFLMARQHHPCGLCTLWAWIACAPTPFRPIYYGFLCHALLLFHSPVSIHAGGVLCRTAAVIIFHTRAHIICSESYFAARYKTLWVCMPMLPRRVGLLILRPLLPPTIMDNNAPGK